MDITILMDSVEMLRINTDKTPQILITLPDPL